MFPLSCLLAIFIWSWSLFLASHAQFTSSGNGSLKVPNTQTTTWTVDVPSYGPLVATTLIYSQTTTYSGAIPPFDAALTGSLSSLCNAQYQSTDTSQYAAMHANAVEYTTTNAANPQGTLVETSITETILGDRPYFATSPPCCGTCNITASTVQVLFWPTSASASLANVTTVVSNGFTFTSPSVYIGFSSILANNLCGQLGKVYINTTLSFGPTELSTLQPCSSIVGKDDKGWDCRTRIGPPKQLNYADLKRNCSTASGYRYIATDRLDDIFGYWGIDPCHPIIKVPKAVLGLDPLWQSCEPNGIGGFYDPPHALIRAAVLTPISAPTPIPPQPVQSFSNPPSKTPPPPVPTSTDPSIVPLPSPINADPIQISNHSAASRVDHKISFNASETPTSLAISSIDLGSPVDPILSIPASSSPERVNPLQSSISSWASSYPTIIPNNQGISYDPASSNSASSALTQIPDPLPFLIPVPSAQSQSATTGSISNTSIVIDPSANRNVSVGGDISLFMGGSAATIAGTQVTVNNDGVVVGSSVTLAIPTYFPPSPTAIATIAGHTIILPPQGSPIIIAGTTLYPGVAVTFPGTTISLLSGSSAIVVGDSTIQLSEQTSANLAIATIAGQTITSPPQGSPIMVAGTTLTPGREVTISGTPVSLAPGSSALVVGSSTLSFGLATSRNSSGLAGFINSGFGFKPSPSSPSPSPSSSSLSAEAFTGEAGGKWDKWLGIWVGAWMVVGAGVVWGW